MPTKLKIIQTVAPDYRANFFSFLRQKLGDRFELYAGDVSFEKSITTNDGIEHVKVRNHYFFNRRFLIQTGIFQLLFSRGVIVMELNPRILSNWIFLIVRRVFGHKTVLWGHAWPREGKGAKTDSIRHIMRKLASEIIVYTKTQHAELTRLMPHKIVHVAPNSIYTQENFRHQHLKDNCYSVVYVGRLVPSKKPVLLAQAFFHVLKDISTKSNLYVVGAGEELDKLESFIDSNNCSDRIKLMGHISDKEILGEIYAKSLVSVSPGYVGLSAIQSFANGVPMIISKDENHAPEIEAAIEGFNALFFETDSVEDLGAAIQSVINRREKWLNSRKEISEWCIRHYSIASMAKAFVNLIE